MDITAKIFARKHFETDSDTASGNLGDQIPFELFADHKRWVDFD